MSEHPVRYACFADIIAAPEAKVGEIVDGVMHLSPRPFGRYCAALNALGEELGPPFKRGRGGPGGWLILAQPELHLRRDVLVPDLAGWRRERLSQVTDAECIRLTPDWACEIISPETAKLDREDKKPLYAAHGVAHLWLVDPLERLLETLRLAEGRWTDVGTYANEDRIRAIPFDAVELELGALWADAVPPPPKEDQ